MKTPTRIQNILILQKIFIISILCVLPLPEFAFCADNSTVPLKKMSLSESIALALRKNSTIEIAFLDRVTQKFDLKVAEDKFVPKLTLSSTVQTKPITTDGWKNIKGIGEFTATATETLPTGALITLTTSRATDKDNASDPNHSKTDSWNLSVTQPLLKGGGIEANTASVQIARMTEKTNLLTLKTTITDTITYVIWAFRSFLQASKQVEINRRALERAKSIVSISKALIEAGRMAELEIVQAEAEVANRELQLLTAVNAEDNAKIALAKLIDIDVNTQFRAEETLGETPAVPAFEALKRTAFEKRPDLISYALAVNIAKLNYAVAKNNRLWDLSLFGSYERKLVAGGLEVYGADTKTWNSGVKLTIPLRDLTLKQNYIFAKINLEKAEINLKKLRDNVELEIKDALRDYEIKLKQMKLSQHSSKLYEKKLEIEREKLRAGRSTNFQVVYAQNDLFNAQIAELTAVISFLNAQSALDKTIGTTLDRWNISAVDRYGEEKFK
ncbi:MAG: TolC family protein [Nitrospirae bacterium]|nr:MAG: TolC family protein [Nitrospirota bacterium]